MLSEHKILVSFKDPDKADEILEGAEMVAVFLKFVKAYTSQQEGAATEEMLPSPYKQASIIKSRALIQNLVQMYQQVDNRTLRHALALVDRSQC